MRADRGFTLVEVLVALVVLAAVMGTALTLHSAGVRGIAAAEAMARATVAANALMEEAAFPVREVREDGQLPGGIVWRRTVSRPNAEGLPAWAALYRVDVEVQGPGGARVVLTSLRFSPDTGESR